MHKGMSSQAKDLGLCGIPVCYTGRRRIVAARTAATSDNIISHAHYLQNNCQTSIHNADYLPKTAITVVTVYVTRCVSSSTYLSIVKTEF